MKAVVHELWPPRWLCSQRYASRIGGNAGNAMTRQQLVAARSEPRGVARFGGHVTGEAPAKHAEKVARRPAIERQAWRKLHEKATKTLSEWGNFEEKNIKLGGGSNESFEVRDRPGHLD